MPKSNNLTDFTTDLADGLRIKKQLPPGIKINPQNFRRELESLITINETLPPQIEGLSITSGSEPGGMITITGSYSSAIDLEGTRIVYKIDNYPASPMDGSIMDFQGKATSFLITGLTNETKYYFRIFPYNNNLQFQTDKVGATITGTPTILLPASPNSFSIKGKNQQAELTWGYSSTIYLGGTRVVYKKGTTYPVSPTDGTYADYDPSIRTATIGSLTNDAVYSFAIFSYNNSKFFNTTPMKQQVTPKSFKVMGIIIDEANSNPKTKVTYTRDAVGLTPQSQAWKDFWGYKDCLLKNGNVVGYLNPDNPSTFVDGTSADITSGNAGDVMVEFPRRGIKFSKSGNNITILATDEPDNPEFSYLAHTYKGQRCDFFYRAKYKGYELSGKLRSLSGKAPTVNKTISAFRNIARANGVNYEQGALYQRTFLIAAIFMTICSTDSQAEIGKGWTTQSAKANTGGSNGKGSIWGEQTGKYQCVSLGIEDFWGNIYEWLDGLFCNSAGQILTCDGNYNDTGSGYVNNGKLSSFMNSGGYISKIMGTNETGFLPAEASGSNTTYYPDYGSLYAGYLAACGGLWDSGLNAGAACVDVRYGASTAYSNLGSCLMYFKVNS